jgi:hypothetical protein
MKRVVLGVCAVSIFLAIGACKKKQIKTIEKNMIEGTWKISSYTDDGNNETSDFAGDVFTFSSDGTVTVTGTHPMSGTWKVDKESDDDMFDDRHLEFILSFAAPLDELSDDWEVESHSDDRLELKDKSGNEENGEDYLTFEKL